MRITQREALEFVNQNDIKFICLAFCDLFGTLKNISILPTELPRAFAGGISFDASAVKGFLNVTESELFLIPDAATLTVLPWRPQTGRVVRLLCECQYPDGRPFESYSREILRRQIQRGEAMGLGMKIGTECEFYLFEADEKGETTRVPQDRAGYMDVAPRDRGENVRREICLALEAMHIQPQTSHHAQGPGQNEIDFQYGSPMEAADQVIYFKTAVQAVAAQYGLGASFMPKPLADESGNGMRVNLSLYKDGKNLFALNGGSLAPEAAWAMAGILRHIREISLFLNPIPNSYDRLGAFGAPEYVSWSYGNRSQLIRIPAARGDGARMELRSPDPSCNPYLAFALLIASALEGISGQYALQPQAADDLTREEKAGELHLARLPRDMGEAIALARESDFLRRTLPPAMLHKYLEEKEATWRRFQADPDQVQSHHFQTI